MLSHKVHCVSQLPLQSVEGHYECQTLVFTHMNQITEYTSSLISYKASLSHFFYHMTGYLITVYNASNYNTSIIHNLPWSHDVRISIRRSALLTISGATDISTLLSRRGRLTSVPQRAEWRASGKRRRSIKTSVWLRTVCRNKDIVDTLSSVVYM